MRYFPISIDTKDKNVLVLGGGALATSRIKTLLDTDFKIYCISGDFTEEILRLKEFYPERLLLKGRTLTEDFVFFGYDYCVIATDDAKLNLVLQERAKKSKIEYFRADNIGESSYKFNNVVENGGLSVSLLSEGLGPEVQKQIESDIQNVLLRYDFEKLNLLNSIRQMLVLRNHPDIAGEIEMLSKKNTAVIKQYQETLERTKPDLVRDFLKDENPEEEIDNNKIDKETSEENKNIDSKEESTDNINK